MGSELERVGEEVADDFVDAIGVPVHLEGQPVLALDAELDLTLHGEHVERALELRQHVVEVHGARLETAAARLEPTDVEQLIHQPRQRVRLRLEGAKHLRVSRVHRPVDALVEQLQVADHDVDRRLELVRRDGHEFRLELVELRELPRHLGEARRELAELVGLVAHRPDAIREVAVRDGAHARAEIENRTADRPGEPERDRAGDDYREQQRDHRSRRYEGDPGGLGARVVRRAVQQRTLGHLDE